MYLEKDEARCRASTPASTLAHAHPPTQKRTCVCTNKIKSNSFLKRPRSPELQAARLVAPCLLIDQSVSTNESVSLVPVVQREDLSSNSQNTSEKPRHGSFTPVIPQNLWGRGRGIPDVHWLANLAD